MNEPNAICLHCNAKVWSKPHICVGGGRKKPTRIEQEHADMYKLLKKSGCQHCQGDGFTIYYNGDGPADQTDCGHCKEKRDLLERVEAKQ